MADQNVNGLPNAALPVIGTDKLVISRNGVDLQQVAVADLPSSGGSSGVSTFAGRSGAVVPVQADYDAFFTTPTEATTLANTAASNAISDHVAAADPHSQYTTSAEATTIANGAANTAATNAIDTHEADANPHPQYLTQAEGDGLYKVTVADEGTALTTGVRSINFTGAGVVANAVGDSVNVIISGGGGGGSGGVAGVSTFNGRDGDVVPQQADYDAFFLTPSEASAAYAPLVHTHVSTDITDFVEAAQDSTGAMVTGNTEDGVSVTYNDASNKLDFANTDKGSTAVAAHVAMADPHGQYKVAVLDEGTSLTTFAQSLNFTGAGVTASATGGAVTVNIPGGGSGGGGGYSLDQLATDVDALVTSTPVDGDFDVTMRDGATPSIVKVLSANAAVALAVGSTGSLRDRITSITSAPAAYCIEVPSRYVDNLIHAGTTNSSYVANRIYLAPFLRNRDLPVETVGIVVQVAGAAGNTARFVICESALDNTPTNLVFSGTTELDVSTTGIKEHLQNFTFLAGKLYWLGVHTNGGFSVLSPTIGVNSPNLGLTAADGGGTTYHDSLTLSSGVTYSSGPPTVFPAFSTTFFSRGSGPVFRMRRSTT